MIDSARIATAGSVDDGKSTLIGRLLVDSKALFDDHTDKITQLGHARGMGAADLAAVTDGLKAEREQGITIDVAYRYFATPKRRFVLLDTPGHEQYTRNMVTGAANAEASIVLVDATTGPKAQTHRHTLIASLLGHQQIIFAINKMDLVGFSEKQFDAVKTACNRLADSLHIPHYSVIPISALGGDGVVERGHHMAWYQGPSLLDHLEAMDLSTPESHATRLPIQWINRFTDDHRQLRRGLTGRLQGGTLAVGQSITLLPEGRNALIVQLQRGGHAVESVISGDDVFLELDRDIDAYRGQLLIPADAMPKPVVTSVIEGTINWFSDTPASLHRQVIVQQGGLSMRAVIERIGVSVDPSTGIWSQASEPLAMNAIARITLICAGELAIDPYVRARTTGSLILIDPYSHETLGLVLVGGPSAHD